MRVLRSEAVTVMPIGEGGENIHVVADGHTTDVVASASEGASAILAKAGVSAGPNPWTDLTKAVMVRAHGK